MIRQSSRRLVGFTFAAAFAFVSGTSEAHFTLQSPAAASSQDALGSPQKLGPCGDEAGGTATGTVTAFQSGQTITVTIDEKIYHAGHYRIALSVNDRSELPAEPPVTPNSSPCGTVPVQDPPVFPILADNVFAHSAPFTSPQSIQITLPADVTCTHCTLQVTEFMSDHPLNNPGGCFYHHCADISLQTTPVQQTSGSGGSGTGTPSSGGCSASSNLTPGAPVGLGIAGLITLAAFIRSRRRITE